MATTTRTISAEGRVISMEHDGCKGCKYERQSQNLEPCISCEGTKKGDHYKKITYGDKIRAMSDEELAELLYSLQNLEDKVKFCKNKDVCTDILDDGKEIPDNMCKECLVEWLQSEYERERAI